MRYRSAQRLALCLGGAVLTVAGCASDQTKDRRSQVEQSDRPLPPIGAVVAGYNARAARIPRLWASTVTVVEFQEQVGEERRDRSEQFEGYFQFIAPRKVALTFDKLGDTYAALGSNDDEFWWLQRGDDPRAYVGRRETANMAGLKNLGVPVSPEDLSRLLGLQPIVASEDEYRLAWTRDGRWLVLVRDRAGEVGEERIALDPETYEPVKVELVVPGSADRGPERFAADLRKYTPVEVRGVQLPGDGAIPRVPERAEISLWNGSTRVRMSLFSAEISSSKPKERVFDLAWMMNTLGLGPSSIERLEDGPIRGSSHQRDTASHATGGSERR